MDTISTQERQRPAWSRGLAIGLVCLVVALMSCTAVKSLTKGPTPSDDEVHQFGSAHAQVFVQQHKTIDGGGFPDSNATRADLTKAVESATNRPVLMVAGATAKSDQIKGKYGYLGVLFTEVPAKVGRKVELISGRLPSAPGEVLVSPEVAAAHPNVKGPFEAVTESGMQVEWTVVGVGRGYFRTDPEDIVAFPPANFMQQKGDGGERWLLVGEPLSAEETRQVEKTYPSMHIRDRTKSSVAEWIAVRLTFNQLNVLSLLACTGLWSAIVLRRGSKKTTEELVDDLPDWHRDHTKLAIRGGTVAAGAGTVAGIVTILVSGLSGETLLLAIAITAFCSFLAFMGPILAVAILRLWDQNRHGLAPQHTLQRRKKHLLARVVLTWGLGALILALPLGFEVSSLLAGEVRWQMGRLYEWQVIVSGVLYLVGCFVMCRKHGRRVTTLCMPAGAAFGWLMTTAPYFGGGLAVIGAIYIHFGVGLISVLVAALVTATIPFERPASANAAAATSA